MSLIFTALVLILGSMVWVVRDRGNAGDVVVAPPPMQVQVISPPVPVSASTSTASPMPAPMPPLVPARGPMPSAEVATQVTETPAAPAAIAPQPKSAPLVHVTSAGNLSYTARDGDTVSDLAVALKGSDSKANRDAVIASDPSLQNNPNRVLTGKTYTVETPQQETSDPAKNADDTSTNNVASSEKPDSERNLKYTAQPGDSVAVLASTLLGGDTKDHREAVISENPSLQQDPNHLVAGQTYNITTTSGLAVDPNAKAAVVPTTQQDADEAAKMSVGRVLRYTAQPGDTVSKLATVLLGSDTKANREAIIENNRSLKQSPDRLVAGQTYWIPAPTAQSQADAATP